MRKQEGLHQYPNDKPLKLKNMTCVYCGVDFRAGVPRTKEHVIGKKFVPKVDFGNQWNLIVFACENCNNAKSELEGELAAISMQPDAFGRFVDEDERLPREAKRKGEGAVSSRTGKPVADSHEKLMINMTGPLMRGVTASFRLITPPQIDWCRAAQLAKLHFLAFFYLITYDRETRQGGRPSGQFAPLCVTFKQDWGNAMMRSFQKEIAEWPTQVHAAGADGFFKLVIRRQEPAELWAWALEWNRNTRLIGLLGDEAPMRKVVAKLPLARTRDGYRKEEALSEDEDHLFDGPYSCDEGGTIGLWTSTDVHRGPLKSQSAPLH